MNYQNSYHLLQLTLQYKGNVHSCTDLRTQSWTLELTLWLYCITLDSSIPFASLSPSDGIFTNDSLSSFFIILSWNWLSEVTDNISLIFSGRWTGNQSIDDVFIDSIWSIPSNKITIGRWTPPTDKISSSTFSYILISWKSIL